MKLLGNLVWLVFAGFVGALGWAIVGVLWCLTLIGIPVGLQCFKIARLTLWPFGKQVVYGQKTTSLLLNLLWLVFGGAVLAIGHVIGAFLLAITLIGFPFALQELKLAKLALMPFGAIIKNTK